MNIINHNIYDDIIPSGVKHIRGWNSYSDVFGQLIEEIQPKTIIEVGTWLGASAINMAKITKELGLNTQIYCIDTWLGAVEFWTTSSHTPERNLKLKNGYPTVYYDFLANVVQHNVQDIIIPIPNTSYIAYLMLKHFNISAELIYVDGSHEYEDVKSDIKCYMEILKPGGIMFGDDMGWPSVRKAVTETLKDDLIVLENNFWVYKKV